MINSHLENNSKEDVELLAPGFGVDLQKNQSNGTGHLVKFNPDA